MGLLGLGGIAGFLGLSDAGNGGGAPTDVDYLVGTADPDLSAEIVVGTTPGGELGGTWASPTIDSVHAGSAHHAEDHRTRHITGGADAFLSTETLEAAIKRIQESGGPTILTAGAIADGQFVKRSGTTLIGDTPTAALPAGTVVRKGFATGGGNLAVVDNIQPMNVSSWTGYTSFFMEYQFQALGPTNAQLTVELDYHAPNHNVINNNRYRWNSAATGAGDIFRNAFTVIAWNNGGGGTMVSGNYHINCTVYSVGAGVFSVQRGQIFGIV